MHACAMPTCHIAAYMAHRESLIRTTSQPLDALNHIKSSNERRKKKGKEELGSTISPSERRMKNSLALNLHHRFDEDATSTFNHPAQNPADQEFEFFNTQRGMNERIQYVLYSCNA